MFQYPFMQRALAAGVIMAALLALLGVFVVLRRMAFFASGIAHASLAGVAIGIIASVNPLMIAIIFAVIFAIIIYLIEKKYSIASDTAIGILFTSGMALGALLISLQPGYQPKLISFLFGNILAIKNTEIWVILVLAVIIFVFILVNLKSITLLSLDEETAYVSGVKVERLNLIWYIMLAVVVVLGIKMLGIVLVSALLIIPVATAKLFARSFKKLLIQSIIFSEAALIGGIVLSYRLDYPTGPTIVLTGAVLFVFSLCYTAVRGSASFK